MAPPTKSKMCPRCKQLFRFIDDDPDNEPEFCQSCDFDPQECPLCGTIFESEEDVIECVQCEQEVCVECANSFNICTGCSPL